jgi:hypothetical protein
MRKSLFLVVIAFLMMTLDVNAQDRTILMPRPLGTSVYDGEGDYFSKAYRWFLESEIDSGVTNLKKVIESTGYTLDPNGYYVVVANFTDQFSPIGIIGKDVDFFDTRLYGLQEENLYYIFISQTDSVSFLSVLATSKTSPFMEHLPGFLGFIGLLPGAQEISALPGPNAAWVEIRQFTIPKSYRKFSDLSFLVKKNLSDENMLATLIIDNSAKERWSFGVAFALTSLRDVDIVVGSDGTIIVQPKPTADPAVFGVINYHFFPVDTKAKTFGNSIHALGGLRVGGPFLEPILGIGGGVSLDIIDLHVFAGYSVEFANELKEEYKIGQKISKEEDPFQLNIRGKLRFGLEVKFP